MKTAFILLTLIIVSCASAEDKEKFIKDYTLLKLDGKSCKNCIVRVNKGHTYDILSKGKNIGSGSWDIENPLDHPGFVLKIENGPNWMIFHTDTVIDYINRKR